MRFVDPIWFVALFLLPVLVWWHRRRKVTLRFSNIQLLKQLPKGMGRLLGWVPLVLRILTLVCLIGALARPQSGRSEVKERRRALDIMLVVDTSGSMQALDFVLDGKRKDRLQVIKRVISEFIANRPDDRIGTVVFGSNAFAQAPLTLDHDVLLQFVDSMEIGMAGEATAIGDAIAVGTGRLREVKAKSKVMILLTDGSNTEGRVDPRQAAEAAKVLGVRIYTIGVGSQGLVPMPTPMGIQQVRADIDEELLKEIATKTEGRYFRAKDTKELQNIYATIDNLEKTEIETKVHHNFNELFHVLLWPALLLMGLQLLFALTRWQRIPL